MNIFLRELKSGLRSLLIWSVIVILFVSVGISKFQAYYGNPEMLKLLDAMPPAVLAAFSFEAFNLTTVNGFYGLMFSYYALILAIAAAMWGSDIISKEERDKTVEFSLTLPVTRSRVVTAKALAALVNSLLLLLVTWGVSVLSVQRYQPDAEFYRFLALCMVALFILQVVFLSIGLLLGCGLKQYRRAGSAAVSVLLVTFFLSVVISINQGLDWLKYLSPFKYFDAGAMLRESRLDPLYVGISIAIIAACLAGAYLSYSKRDLAI
ncbi:MAG TPA: ABC transporter permease subunit [Anaerolineae bacterium]|nr:ABC transporter permease subunit [Anaerolineae bacterium]